MSDDKKTLILCVDRDDDIGRKTNKKSPVIGREKNLELANALALADPEDSDPNAIFEGVRIHDLRESEGKRTEIATITGDPEVGIKSDEKLTKELQEVLKATRSTEIILVTDGTEDEHIIPIIQGHAKILSVRRVVMKQSERLEGMYYMVHDFLKQVINNPKMARLVLGIPALILLLYSLFGLTGWRFILGGIGIYLLIKGFQLEEPIKAVFSELKTSLTTRRISFFIYIVSFVFLSIGIKSGYDMIQIIGPTSLIVTSSSFLKGSIYLLFLSFLLALGGKAISAYPDKQHIIKLLTFAFLGFSITLVAYEASNVLLNPEIGLFRLFASILFGLLLTSVSLTFSKIFG